MSWIAIAAAVVTLGVTSRLAARRRYDVGAVSASWIARHRLDAR